MGTFRKSNVVGQVVTSFTVDDLAITTAKLAAGAITEAKRSLLIRNETGGSLAEGDLVYVSGWNETQARPLVSKADADAAGAKATYIMQAALANNTNGTAYKTHRLTGLNVGGAVGDRVYLSTTAAGWTLTAPAGSDDIVQVVGRVAVVSASVGVVEFNLDANNLEKIATNEVQALAITTATIAANAVTQAKVASQAFDGTIAANIADKAAGVLVAADFGIPQIVMLTVPAGVTGDVDWTTPASYKIRVIDVWLKKTTAAGGGAGTIQVKNSATAITNAISIDIADKTIGRATEIDDAQQDIAAAGTLRVTRTRTASTDESCVVYVKCVRVA